MRDILSAVGCALAVPPVAAFLLWYERRLLARLQVRLGPNRVGPQGLWQSLADIVKLLSKSDVLPDQAHHTLYRWAPVGAFVPVFVAFAALPELDPQLNIGVLFVGAVLSLEVLAILAAGFGSHSKYALIGSLRATAQMVSYEVPLSLALLGPALAAGSLNLHVIAQHEAHLPYIVSQPLGALGFFVAGLAETHRPPFDLSEAESELVAGYHVEYSGVRFALFVVSEYAHLLLFAWLMAVLYLGAGPVWWLALKIMAVVSVVIWLRAAWPRIRPDHLMALGWKVLIPLTSLNVMWIAVWRVLTP
ncbi:NADH dehydrogenase (quinone) [Sulfobacillus acidophilus TPY]|uniref:NADH-quinone oxidoreductase subunit H n=1 Tax=Sulfobacillus acidophilus (strain ATCC 700253 / DSM 10332 / NAL) TaxID=679936 RepID=G8TX68_SULAD|nr:NADH dehydrogenase (quinone) [Sulfobacillus acidophilus TPY]AEW06070.1 NAD(P)H-quinone oxidoreductase subunit 1 [Sulfobacillus acidophilus DSM 10332]